MHGQHFNPHLSPANGNQDENNPRLSPSNGNQDEMDHDHDLDLSLSLSPPLHPSLPTPNLARATSPSSSPNSIMVLFPSSSSSTLNFNPIMGLFPSSSSSTLNSNSIMGLFPSSSSSTLNSNSIMGLFPSSSSSTLNSNSVMGLFPSSSSSTLNSNSVMGLFPSSSSSTLNYNSIMGLFPSSSISTLNSNSMLSSPNPTTTVVSQSPPRSPSPTANPTAPTRWRRQLLPPGKTERIPAPYPWAKERRAAIRSLKTLVQNGIFKIVGKMMCKYCEKESEIEYDLQEKFSEVERFIVNNKSEMYHRAPEVWNNPRQGNCDECNRESAVRPVIEKKRNVNWLFLFLGQMVGFCGLEHLRYFCKHTRNHQTGARNRLLYIVYLSLWKQLNPNAHYVFFI